MSEPQHVDSLGRPLLAEGMKRQIEQAFSVVPEGKRGALLIIADSETKTARAHLAAKIGEKGDWKVAAGPGFDWVERKPTGWVAIMGAW